MRIYGYVVMPEHVHWLVSEPAPETLADAMHFLKLSFTKRLRHTGSFWQKRYRRIRKTDRNIRAAAEFDEKLGYIHLNPVKRGLVKDPAEWEWSSFRHYSQREVGRVEIESEWTAHDREKPASRADPQDCFSAQVSAKVRREPGAPGIVRFWFTTDATRIRRSSKFFT